MVEKKEVEKKEVEKKPGPISQRLIKSLHKFQKRKVIDFKDIAAGTKQSEDLQKTVASYEELADLHQAHAVYVYTQNQISVLSDQITQLPEMSEFVDLIGKAEEEYMPSGPPMSPLTASYFTCWALFDASVGEKRETIGTCIIDLGGEIGMSPELLRLIVSMQESRMGLYVHRGMEGPCAILREMVTGAEYRTIVPSGHRGKKGELWLVRILPPPILGQLPCVAFTTPYVILQPGENEWRSYLSRTLPRIEPTDEQQAYEELMKYGMNSSYWNEYILEAYLNHRTEAIFLCGLPDVAESRPHSDVNS